MDKNKLILPISILLGCTILGGFFYATQINKQESIERQQQIDLQAKKEANQIKLKFEEEKYKAEIAAGGKEQQKEIEQTIQHDEENKTEIYRKECIKKREETITDFENFMDVCLNSGTSNDDCLNSPAGKLYNRLILESIDTCIEGKRKLLY